MHNCKVGRIITAVTLFVVLLISGNAIAQSPTYQVSVDRLFYNRYPEIEAYVSVLDVQGFPMTGLDEGAFSIKLDGVETEDFQVSQYTNTEETLAIVLAIDTSGSMNNSKKPTPLENSVEAATKFVNQLSSQDLVALITFADNVILQSDLTTDKTKINEILDSLEPKGATAINDAVVDSINLLKNRPERRAIILLTDGKPDGDQVFTFDQALAHASSYKIPIYPIGFGAVDKNQIERLANLTGGSGQVKPDSLALFAAFDKILGIFREQYFLKIISSIVPDNKDHTLEVTVLNQGSDEKGEATFVARDPILLTVTSPDADSTLNGTVPISAEVDVMNAVTSVEFFVDEELIDTVVSPPYQVDWDTTQFVTGDHKLTVRAYDDLGFEKEQTMAVLVELQRQDWIYWLIGLVVLCGAALFLSIGLRRRKAPPHAARKAALIEIEGHQPEAVWELDKDAMNLGRLETENDIHLKGAKASRHHATIEKTADGYIITSLKQENPLIINGRQKIQATLKEGDTIQLGDSLFRFEYKQ